MMKQYQDGNGQITLQELKEVMGCGDEDLAGLQEIILSADQDNDGQISFPEFKLLMKKMYNQ